jgi:hypothetical protein
MYEVRQEADRVIIDLRNRRTDVVLTCAMAWEMAEALEIAAGCAEQCLPTLVKGDRWEVAVASYDGKVCLRFYPPFPGAPTLVPMPAKAARQLADRIRSEASWAQHNLRLEIHNEPTRH